MKLFIAIPALSLFATIACTQSAAPTKTLKVLTEAERSRLPPPRERFRVREKLAEVEHIVDSNGFARAKWDNEHEDAQRSLISAEFDLKRRPQPHAACGHPERQNVMPASKCISPPISSRRPARPNRFLIATGAAMRTSKAGDRPRDRIPAVTRRWDIRLNLSGGLIRKSQAISRAPPLCLQPRNLRRPLSFDVEASHPPRQDHAAEHRPQAQIETEYRGRPI